MLIWRVGSKQSRNAIDKKAKHNAIERTNERMDGWMDYVLVTRIPAEGCWFELAIPTKGVHWSKGEDNAARYFPWLPSRLTYPV